MAAQMLMKRGKRTVANVVKNECLHNAAHSSLRDLLDHLLSPTRTDSSIQEVQVIDWLRWLIAGGETFEDFGKLVRSYDNATTCGLVWTADFVAYRCRTCGISPCMSLCADCFQEGNHEGHDFNMFRSQAGGACDCGDVSVMNANGFCPRHGPDQAKKQPAPPELLAVAKVMMPRLLWRIIEHMRDGDVPGNPSDSHVSVMKDAEDYLTFLHQLSDMGASMREVFTQAMLSKDVYRQYTQCAAPTQYQKESEASYLAAKAALHGPPVPVEFRGVEGLGGELEHTTLLEELLFWTVKFEFPQQLVTLMLSILPNDEYKEAFTKAFVQHYSHISIALVNSKDRSRISNRVVHISVQLLSPELLANKMVDDYKLLYIMLGSLHHMVEGVLVDSGISGATSHQTVDCSKGVLRDHCYWPIVSDLINVLSHKNVAIRFMEDKDILLFWFNLLSYFQGMNVNNRQLSHHVEHEPETYYAAFSAELEICSSTMWSMLVHCKDQSTCDLTKSVIKTVTRVLRMWCLDVGIRPYPNTECYRPSFLQVTFHLPLHRYLSVFLCQAIMHQGLTLQALLPDENFAQMLMIHPLRIQVVFHEILTGMWVRNGLQIRGQSMTYIQCHFCNSMVDADLYLLQLCASVLNPDSYLKTVLENFRVVPLLRFAPRSPSRPTAGSLDTDREMPMLEGALTFLCTLLCNRSMLGMTEQEVTRHEMVTLLCISDRTHSQITELMPEKCGLNSQSKHVDETLKQIADYKAPNFEAGGAMQQGMYVPKGEIWATAFDPMYVMHRAMHRKDFQGSMDRYTAYVKTHNLYKGSSAPWPPFRIPQQLHPQYKGLLNLLQCRTMHAIIFKLLHSAINEKTLPDAVIYLTIYLLDMSLSLGPSPDSQHKVFFTPDIRRDRHFTEWYSTDSIYHNSRFMMDKLEVTVEYQESHDLVYDDGDDDEDMTDDMFQLTSGSSVPVNRLRLPGRQGHRLAVYSEGGASSEVINAVQSMLEEVESSDRFRNAGVSANMRTVTKSMLMPIGESILTLLLKLHSKLSGTQNSYVPESMRGACSSSDAMNSESRLGDGPFFVGKVLDKLCADGENMRIVEEEYRKCMPKATSAGAKRKDDREERKRKARERQEKLMREFASKQKEFLEKNMDEDWGEEEEPMDTEPIMKEEHYECVICNQSMASTWDRPFCLVTLLQPSSVLGVRRHSDWVPKLPISDSTQPPSLVNCGTDMQKKLESLLQHFDEMSALMSMNIGWQGGVYSQTCGHYVHFDCHSSYISTLRAEREQPSHQMLRVDKGEYRCPLCRQLANTVLPIIPDVGPAVIKPLPDDPVQLVLDIANVMETRPVTLGPVAMTRMMGTVMENITNATYARFKTCAKSTLAENVLLFVCSVLRSNLEMELMQAGGRLCTDPSSTLHKKSFVVPLFNVLSLHSKVLTTDSKIYLELWAYITGVKGVLKDADGTSVCLYNKGVPLLLKDVSCLLVQLTLNMPVTVEKERYQCFVQVLYNVIYVQALAVISCKFSEEERTAWRSKAKDLSCETLESLLGQVISRLLDSAIYEDDADSDPHVPAICQSVWSPSSVEMGVQDIILPYLRIASLLQHHLYKEDLPIINLNCDTQEEYTSLCQYLSLTLKPTTGGIGVKWYTKEPHTLVQSWCSHFGQFVSKHPFKARTLLIQTPSWGPPKLLLLPREYDKIFQYYRKKCCARCKSLPKDTALCLVCGRLQCLRETCCQEGAYYECVRHSIECGAGTGLYLIVQSSLILVIRGPRATIWGSVYLDEHGEEDKDLKRGKPLYLSEARYRLLEQQWIQHSFDRVCKRWIFHNDKL